MQVFKEVETLTTNFFELDEFLSIKEDVHFPPIFFLVLFIPPPRHPPLLAKLDNLGGVLPLYLQSGVAVGVRSVVRGGIGVALGSS